MATKFLWQAEPDRTTNRALLMRSLEVLEKATGKRDYVELKRDLKAAIKTA